MLTPEGERAPKIEQLPRTEAFVLPEPEREQARKIFSFELPAEGLAGRYDLRIPRGDLGLKYAEKTIVQLGTSGTDLQNSRGFYQVDEASTKARVVRLAPKSYLDDNLETRPRYCFDRRYVLSLGGNERDTKLKKGNPRIIHFDDLTLTIEHLHMCFERRTFGFYTVPEDRLPFADGQAPPYNRLNAASTLTRQRFRSVLHLFLANMTLPAVAPEDLAFTSCVALHDVLAALFPREACRLAVLSPQALPLYARADAGRDALDLFILRTYCLLEQPAVPATAASDAAPSIDLYLVEDADYDLGVAGAVASKHTAIFKHLSEYLGWLDEKSNQAPPYHALGRPTPPAFLVFKEAYELLAPIVGRSQQP